MIISMIISNLELSGLTTHTLDLCNGLSKQGHKINLFVGRRDNYSKRNNEIFFHYHNIFSKINNLKIIDFKLHDTSFIGKLRSTITLMQKLLRTKSDIVHLQSIQLSFIPWLLNKSFISTMHINDLVPSFYCKRATHLIAISEETRRRAIEVLGYKDNDVTIINHGVSTRFAKELTITQKKILKEKYNIPTDKIIIGLIGSIEYRKGHDILLKAIAQLSENNRQKIHVIFCGSDKTGKNTKWLHNIITETNTDNTITHVEYQDPLEIYQILDIFCLPSRLEGFPIVSLEAMLANCCCIRSNTEGCYEQIENGINGYIFENENINQLSDIITNLINNTSLIKELADNGKQKALNNFTIECMTKKTVKIYNQIINQKII